MKRFRSQVIVVATFVASILLRATLGFAEETSEKVYNPFLVPQLNIVLGNLDSNFYIANDYATSSFHLSSSGINTFGFDLEVNYSEFMNIGAYFRVEAISTDDKLRSQFNVILGGFTRFFYVPPFLKGKTHATNLFARLDLGGGPFILTGPSGLTSQAGIFIGTETYFSKWFGIGLSYGRIFEYGKETLLRGIDANDSFVNAYKDATVWNRGSVLLLSLKSTFF